MIDISTNYMGLKIQNPIIVASCGITKTSEGVRRCADSGAGAVVLKSLFEEQIEAEIRDMKIDSWPQWHPEAFDYIKSMSLELGPREYLKLIEDSKKAVSIPVIASLNCISSKQWIEYAKRIAVAGADALELNISVMSSSVTIKGEKIEQIYFRIIEEVKSRINIPIAVKISPYFTAIARTASELANRGASAIVLFNRFYQIDINIDKLELSPGYKFSTPHEINIPLRWIALLSGRIKCDLAASTGIHDAKGVIKQILAGASAVQICSILYIKNIEQIRIILEDIEKWMIKHNFNSIDQIKGKMSQLQSDQPELYERLQYIKALSGIQ